MYTLTGQYATESSLTIVVSDMTGNKRIEKKTVSVNKALAVSLEISKLPKGITSLLFRMAKQYQK